ncbi:MAG: hypothetical protein Kow00107_09000 [Planctomycetota bacterium]
MGGSKLKQSQINSVPSSMLKRLSSRLGYPTLGTKAQLVATLASSNSFNDRFSGLLASLPQRLLQVYKAISDSGANTPADLAKAMSVPVGKLTESLFELESTGLIEFESPKGSDAPGHDTFFHAFPMVEGMEPPAEDPVVSTQVTVQQFFMDLVRLLQMVRQKAPRILSDGTAGVRFLNKLEGVVLTSKDFPKEHKDRYLLLLYQIALETGLTYIERKELCVSDKTDEFFSQPLHVRIQELFEGWLRDSGTHELEFSKTLRMRGKAAPGSNDIPDAGRLQLARRMLSESLASLGTANRWYSLEDFVWYCRTRTPDLLVKSVSEDEAIEHTLAYRGIFTDSPTDLFDGIPRTDNWNAVEGEFIRIAMETLSLIGVVILSDDKKWFRFTQEGMYCLGLCDEPEECGVGSKCFVVQPNFEVVAYADRSTPEILHVLGSFGDLVSDQESLVYRMSLQSIYRAAESSLTFEDIANHLEKHSMTEVPANVMATLREWWNRCNQVYYFPCADLIELSDSEPFEKLPDAFKKCSMRSGDFLIFSSPVTTQSQFIDVVDYRKRAKCCKISEEGIISIDKRKADFFLITDLRRMTVPGSEKDNELRMRIDYDKIKGFKSFEGKTGLELLREVCDFVPPKLALTLMSAGESLPAANYSPLVALTLPKRVSEEGLAEELMAGISVGKLDEAWLLTEERFNELKVTFDRIGLSLNCSKVAPAENNRSAKSGAVKPAADKTLSSEEKLRIINRAIEGSFEIEILYSLPSGTKRMVVQPTHLMTSTNDSVVEANDRLSGTTVLLTASNIASIRRIIRRSH